jgi:predicted transcriptional regulator
VADDKRPVSLNLGDELLSRLDEHAAKIDRSRSWLARQILTAGLDRLDEQNDSGHG